MKPPRKIIIEDDSKKMEHNLNFIFRDIYTHFGEDVIKRKDIPIPKIIAGDPHMRRELMAPRPTYEPVYEDVSTDPMTREEYTERLFSQIEARYDTLLQRFDELQSKYPQYAAILDKWRALLKQRLVSFEDIQARLLALFEGR